MYVVHGTLLEYIPFSICTTTLLLPSHHPLLLRPIFLPMCPQTILCIWNDNCLVFHNYLFMFYQFASFCIKTFLPSVEAMAVLLSALSLSFIFVSVISHEPLHLAWWKFAWWWSSQQSVKAHWISRLWVRDQDHIHVFCAFFNSAWAIWPWFTKCDLLDGTTLLLSTKAT